MTTVSPVTVPSRGVLAEVGRLLNALAQNAAFGDASDTEDIVRGYGIAGAQVGLIRRSNP